MSELAAFLESCIAADEEAARAATVDGDEWFSRYPNLPDCHMYGEFGWVVSGPAVETEDSELGKAQADHIAIHDPVRVLADCEALRAIVALHWDATYPTCPTCAGDEDFGEDSDGNRTWYSAEVPSPCPTLLALAQPFAGRPGWDESWRINTHKETQR